MKQKKPYPYKKISVHGRKIDEHRYVMEQHVGRYLQRNEVIKHKNGNLKDNRLENLSLMSRSVQTYTQIYEGKLHVLNKEDVAKSTATSLKKFGKKVMICDIVGNELMIVASVRMAARLIGASPGNASDVFTGRKKQTHGFTLKPHQP